MKKFFKITCLYICIFFSNNILSKTLNKQNNRPVNKHDKVMSISIPKSGTHLLLKCLTLFNDKKLSYNYNYSTKPSPQDLVKIRESNKHKPPLHYTGLFDISKMGPLPEGVIHRIENLHTKKLFWTHWFYTHEFENYLHNHTYANFLIIRDPRDMVVSFAQMIQKRPENHPDLHINQQEISLENIITDLITGNKQYYVPWGVEIQQTYPMLWDLGLYNFYQRYIPWAQAKNFLVVRFEELVGHHGGGSSEKQIQTIKKIGAHLGIVTTEQVTNDIIQKLFGGTSTFREGQIGSWKNSFTPTIKEIFKQDARLLQLLIDLGYEQDTNW